MVQYFIWNVDQWIWVHFTLISHLRLWPNKPVSSVAQAAAEDPETLQLAAPLEAAEPGWQRH